MRQSDKPPEGNDADAVRVPRDAGAHSLARRLGLFDATMLVMGGIVGAGIFVNPHVVARAVPSPALILGAWLAGGLVALAGAFVYAELAARRPEVGGQYAYLRDAFHPSVAFLYGWALLLVVQTGGMAAVAVTFARYFLELTGWPLAEWTVAAVALAALTAVNCAGVRAGGTVQSVLMVLKIAAFVTLICAGLAALAPERLTEVGATARRAPLDQLTAFFGALTPVMFAYGGWQTASFVAAEMRDPRRDLARGLLYGVAGVIVLYTAVNFVCVGVLGAAALAETPAPASAVMRVALGEAGARFIAAGIALSALGFLSQGMLTAPRVYFAMAEDRLFFAPLARVSRRTRAPVWAIALQGALAILIAAAGRYEQILNYVVSVDFIFFGLTGLALFVFRGRRTRTDDGGEIFRAPGHPVTTAFFVAACGAVVAVTIYREPLNSAAGLLILLAGVPAFLFWRTRQRKGERR
ncbi:MAG TPA: APC family permease [Pyrinomonadaceae bacterium]|nr:APC family permease [Pyrinomonadaceae bacterium]